MIFKTDEIHISPGGLWLSIYFPIPGNNSRRNMMNKLPPAVEYFYVCIQTYIQKRNAPVVIFAIPIWCEGRGNKNSVNHPDIHGVFVAAAKSRLNRKNVIDIF